MKAKRKRGREKERELCYPLISYSQSGATSVPSFLHFASLAAFVTGPATEAT